METRILLEKDQPRIMSFENERLEKSVADSMEREMKSWDARWRREALEHYLPQGWSFGVFEGERLRGYVLAQPYLFHRGLTQTLWVEHLSASDTATAQALIDVVHRWARDKHLQTVLMEYNSATAFVLEDFPKAMRIDQGLIELRSARF